MTTIRMVRHGRAAAGWDADVDPDLDAVGRAQAAALADRLAPLGPMDVLTSPLRRCRSTVAELAARWRVTPVVEPLVAEIPSPEGVPMAGRVDWLRAATGGTWSELGERYTGFRDAAVRAVCELASDTVVCSHFVAINAVIGHCLGDDRLVVRRLDNCSVTTFTLDAGRLVLVEGGHEADTLIR